jgi:hypothetical protein
VIARSASRRAASPFENTPARIGDTDANHLCRRATWPGNDFAVGRYKAFLDKAGDHGAIETVGKREQVLINAVRKTS